MKKLSFLLAAMLLSALADAQPPLRLKELKPGSSEAVLKSRTGRFHVVIQFTHSPSAEELLALREHGAVIVSYVPDFAFVVSIPDVARLDGLAVERSSVPESKSAPAVSLELGASSPGIFPRVYWPRETLAGSSERSRNSHHLIAHSRRGLRKSWSDIAPR